MTQPIFRIFVSSTYDDLIDYRKSAALAINEQGQKYEGMEFMGAIDKEPTKACLDLIDKCDLFIGIYAWRYGHIPKGKTISITEEEYQHARKEGKPCLCYFVNEKFPWIPGFIDDGEGRKKLADFKAAISENHVRATFKAAEDLKHKVFRDLANWLADNQPELNKAVPKAGENPQKLYLKAIVEKYATLSMIGFKRNFDMEGIYIPLTVHADREGHLLRHKTHEVENWLNHSLTAEDLLTLPEKRAVVLGEPGMGKTTMLHYLALKVSKKGKKHFPIFVKLSEFSKSGEPLESYLLTAVANHIPGKAMRQSAESAIAADKALVLLDGLDEVSRSEYNPVTERIRAFVAARPNCRVIITSRKAGFQSSASPYPLFEVDKLPLSEIENFVGKWFDDKADLFNRIAGNRRLHELAENPFLLSIICFIFEKQRNLPERRLELYEKCATTLLTLYDEKRINKLNQFTRHLKERVLEDLAYHFFCKGIDEFAYDPLIEEVGKTLNEMNKSANEETVLQEIRENSGLLQKSDDKHLFVHRTFYEYYVSRKMRTETAAAVFSRAGEALWEEPVRLYAAQIATTEDGTAFMKKLWKKEQTLALRCYPDMDQVVEADLIKRLFYQSDVKARVKLVKGLPAKIAEVDKLVETLRELFRWETNGEVLYWGVEILESKEVRDIPGARGIVYEKLDKDAAARYKEYIEKDMVKIPAGQFYMGGKEYNNEKPIHDVKLSAFQMSRYAVTNWLYEEFDVYHRQQRDKYSEGDDQPVIYVNWYEAVIFSRWLGCRLPTEAEWEHACRAGTTTPFHTGENLTTDQANYHGNYPYKDYPKGKYLARTSAVGSYSGNDWNLYDMHGNVWEWCSDWYDEKYYSKSPAIDPPGPAAGSHRVLRGGSWNYYAQDCRSAYRNRTEPGVRLNSIGFRLVFVPQ